MLSFGKTVRDEFILNRGYLQLDRAQHQFDPIGEISTQIHETVIAVVFEAIPLYNKIVLTPATAKEVRKVTSEQVSRKNRKCAGKI